MADADRFIPEESRRLVETRDLMHCASCGGPGYEWHHRRSRRVRAAHRHCACNGVLLCATCHRWAHDNPEEARDRGLIVSQWVEEPFLVPLVDRFGYWFQLICNGDYRPVKREAIVSDGVGGWMVEQVD